MSAVDIAWCLFAMGLAAVVQSVSGFGFALMAVPLAAIAVNLTTAVIAVSIASVINVSMLVLRNYRDIDRGLAMRFNVPALFGMPLGLVVLATIEQQQLKVVLGGLIILGTLALMRGAGGITARAWIDVMAGAISGVLAASTGTNGPPLVLAAQMRKLSPDVFRATMSFTFIVSGPLSLIFFAFGGYFSWPAVWLAAGSIPLLVVGQIIGLRIRPLINEKQFARFVYLLLLLSGISVGLSGLVG